MRYMASRRSLMPFRSPVARLARRFIPLFSTVFSLAIVLLPGGGLLAQTLEFESGGLTYQAVTHSGVTVMYAPLPTRILGYSIVQIAISNGSSETWEIRPESTEFLPAKGTRVKALAAADVVADVFRRAGRGDVGRLVAVYESALFGNPRYESTNGYESRRRDAMSFGTNTGMRAAAAAAAIILGTSVLEPGASTDGAIFIPYRNQPLGTGTLRVIVQKPPPSYPLPQETPGQPINRGLAFDFRVAPPTEGK